MIDLNISDIKNIDFSNSDIDKSLPTISISAVLDSVEIPFDSENVAKKTHDSHYDNPESQYFHKSVQEILDMWALKGATSRKYGSYLDDYIGYRLNNEIFIHEKMDDRLHGLMQSFDNFYELMTRSGDVEFIAREKTIYYKIKVNGKDWLVKGRFDALFYNKRINKYLIIDWKSSGSIDKVKTRYTKNFLGPMKAYPALNYYRYTNQLHFYKLALLCGGYLPKGVTEDDIIVMIVNLPGHIIENTEVNYMVHKAAMQFNEALLNDLFTYAINEKIKQDSEKSISKDVEESNNFINNIF